MTSFSIRHANPTDVQMIKQIGDDNRPALGFLPRAKVEEAVDANRVMVLTTVDEVVGFVIYRHRKTDRQTTLSDICVAEKWRGHMGGQLLIDALHAECAELDRDFILLKCPEDLSANRFYHKVGFCHVRTESGRARKLNVWRLDVNRIEAS